LVEIAHVLAAVLLVLREVVGSPVGNAFQLLGLLGKREHVFDIGSSNRIVSQLLLPLLARPKIARLDAELGIPLLANIPPVFVPLHRLAGMAEELDLHLLELATAERVIARID